jgi:hypothetical protein
MRRADRHRGTRLSQYPGLRFECATATTRTAEPSKVKNTTKGKRRRTYFLYEEPACQGGWASGPPR